MRASLSSFRFVFFARVLFSLSSADILNRSVAIVPTSTCSFPAVYVKCQVSRIKCQKFGPRNPKVSAQDSFLVPLRRIAPPKKKGQNL